MTPWLSIIGVGDDGLDYLSKQAREALEQATLIIGGDRHLAMLPEDDKRATMSWPSPLMKLVEDVLDRRGEKTCILATGDPMHYGIGVTFAKQLPAEEIEIFAAPSAFSLAAARMAWDLTQTTCMTLHGRPLELLTAHLTPDAKIFTLSDNGETPAKVAAILINAGFGDSEITVLEHMGGLQENRISSSAKDWNEDPCQDLNTIAIHCKAGTDANPLSTAPGLPDDAFEHDGQLTKKEIRSATLSALAPLPGQLLWDVGAGCGSIGIEWMRLNQRNKAIAIESHEKRLNFIENNRKALGVPGLQIVAERAPDGLADLPEPDAIFIGGGLTNDWVLEACWQKLKPGGILIANTVTVEGETMAFKLSEKHTGQLTRLNFARAEKIGGFTSWKPYRQVTQLKLVKV